MRVADLLGRDAEEALQQVLLILVQQGAASAATLVTQASRVEGLGVSRDPVVDALPCHAEHASHVSGGAATVELQDGEGTLEQPSITGLAELPSEALPLPGGQVEPAHALLLRR
jgi:hypothetical protein